MGKPWTQMDSDCSSFRGCVKAATSRKRAADRQVSSDKSFTSQSQVQDTMTAGKCIAHFFAAAPQTGILRQVI
jgi:hypothetical protein